MENIDNADPEVGQELEAILNDLPNYNETVVKESLLCEYLAQLTRA